MQFKKAKNMLDWVRSDWIDRFVGDEQANIAMIVALSVLPVAAIAGFAIDFQLTTTQKNKMQLSLDSASIAGCRALQEGQTHEEVTQVVQKYFRSVNGLDGDAPACIDPEVSIGPNALTSDSGCTQQTTLGAVAGIEEIDYSIHSACTYGIGKLDVAFVFDVSGSMQGSRMQALKAAATESLDTLMPEGNSSAEAGDVRVAMVAYNDSLNAGDMFEAATGKPQNQTYSYYHYYYRRWFSIPYQTTCVYERIGDESFSDAAPNHSIDVENTGSNNSGDYITGANFWDRNECRDSEPLSLTNDKDVLKDYIDALDPEGGTAGHLGVAWGWYMISPEWNDHLESPANLYDEPDTAKALILMTDGDFNSEFNWQLGSSRSQAERLCDSIKDKNVTIYSVAFQAPSSGQAVLEYCSSDASTFFDPSNGQELTQAYQAIATSISDLRITE